MKWDYRPQIFPAAKNRILYREPRPFEHEGEQPRRLRKKVESLIAEAKEEDLARIARVLEALVH
jgi:hypothetical protein